METAIKAIALQIGKDMREEYISRIVTTTIGIVGVFICQITL
jgi:hypothetical protein